MNPRERHFTCIELGTLWNVSACTVRRRFRDEPGVVVISNPRRGCRIFETLRIPESVAERVYNQDHPKKPNHRPPTLGGAR